MGTYINPGNESMKKAVRSQIYVDKTGMLRVLNENINGEKCCFAVSRPRRFGKSQACGMIDAYYSVGCDSRDLFAPFEIAGDAGFEEHQGKCPAMIVELKWNRSAKAAIRQIKEKRYAGALSGYPGEILLVGINYSKKTGKYSCRIESVCREGSD